MSDMIEPSDTELAELPDTSRRYIESLEVEIDRLLLDNEGLKRQVKELKSMLREDVPGDD